MKEDGRSMGRTGDLNWPQQYRTFCSVPKLVWGGAVGLVATGRQAEHQSVDGEQLYCVSLVSLSSLQLLVLFYFTLFQLLNCSYPSLWVLPFSESPPHLTRVGGSE